MDPSLGLVYGVLARVSTRTFGVSELTIRIPSIIGGLLFWTGLSYFCRRLVPGWFAVAAFAAISANPWTCRAFSTVHGAALAAGLLMVAARLVPNHIPAATFTAGLAIGSDARFAVPVLAAGSLVVPFLKVGFWKWVDELLLPCLIPGIFLLLPGLLVRERPTVSSTDDRGTRDLVRTIPRQSGPVLVGTSKSIEAGVFFYRRRYHLDWMRIEPVTSKCGYYLIAETDRQSAAKLGLRPVKQLNGVALTAPEVIP